MVHFDRTVVTGKTLRLRFGTATTSHSSPLDLWTVMSWTASAPDGLVASRPRSCSRAARRKARKECTEPSLSRPSKFATTSTKAAMLSRRWAVTASGLAASSTSSPVTSTTRWMTSSSGSSTWARR